MCEYNPDIDPDPDTWNLLDEGERLEIIQQYHERYDAELPDVALHCLIHAVVENQVALGDETPVASILSRLKAEGLDRHDAIHAIASVLVNYIHEMMSDVNNRDQTEQYYEALGELTAESLYSQDSGAS